jgi:hypothetical protein
MFRTCWNKETYFFNAVSEMKRRRDSIVIISKERQTQCLTNHPYHQKFKVRQRKKKKTKSYFSHRIKKMNEKVYERKRALLLN